VSYRWARKSSTSANPVLIKAKARPWEDRPFVMVQLRPQQATKDVNSMKWVNRRRTSRTLAVIPSSHSTQVTTRRNNSSTWCKLGTLDRRVMTLNAGLRVNKRLRLTAIRLPNVRGSPT
jgi:hypothetical protein